MRKTTWRRWRNLPIHAILMTGAISCLIPFAWMVSTSLKLPSRVLVFPPQFIPDPVVWRNYVRIFAGFPFAVYLRNTITVSVIATTAQLASCSLGAYAFARIDFPGREKLFLIYLGTMMLPGQVTMIPTFILMKYLGFIDTLYALTVPAFFGSVFGTFLLRQFFMTIPHELEDAATLDGCGHLSIFWRIVLPLAKPALATLAVFTFMGSWNDFFGPLIYINNDANKTLALGLVSIANIGLGNIDLAVLMAGAALSQVPILIVFLAAQRYFVQGITLTGLKA